MSERLPLVMLAGMLLAQVGLLGLLQHQGTTLRQRLDKQDDLLRRLQAQPAPQSTASLLSLLHDCTPTGMACEPTHALSARVQAASELAAASQRRRAEDRQRLTSEAGPRPEDLNIHSRFTARQDGADLKDAQLAHAEMLDIDLSMSNLSGAVLDGADLKGADLTGSWMQGASLKGSDLVLADFSGATLSGAELTGSRAQRADFTDAVITGAHWEGAQYDDQTTWPAGFDPAAAGALYVPLTGTGSPGSP